MRDVRLPDLDGFEICRRLRADPATASVPVLHLSATFVETEARVEGPSVALGVRDVGEGIAPERLERVFDPFFQVGSAGGRRKAAGQGSGLGLAIVRRLVDLRGGRIWAESEGIGRGSTFKVRLPRRLPARRAG